MHSPSRADLVQHGLQYQENSASSSQVGRGVVQVIHAAETHPYREMKHAQSQRLLALESPRSPGHLGLNQINQRILRSPQRLNLMKKSYQNIQTRSSAQRTDELSHDFNQALPEQARPKA